MSLTCVYSARTDARDTQKATRERGERKEDLQAARWARCDLFAAVHALVPAQGGMPSFPTEIEDATQLSTC